MKLIIVRHGETEDNKAGFIQGHLPGILSSEGIEQAKKVAIRLKDEKIDAIYSSDLKRAKDTAAQIAKYHPKIKVNYTEELRERSYGGLEGIHKSKIDWSKLHPDVESDESLFERGKKFFDKVYDKHKNQTVLFVTHGGIQLCLYFFAQNKTHKEFPKEIVKLHNTSVTIIQTDENKNHKLLLFNCNKHLN